jgi:hypothetical protein
VENSLVGNPQSEWDIGMTAGDPSIQGFATDVSVGSDTDLIRIYTWAIAIGL